MTTPPAQVDRDREASRGRLPPLVGTLTLRRLREALARDAVRRQVYEHLAALAEIEGAHGPAALLRELAESSGALADGHIDLLRRAGEPLTGAPMGGAEQSLRSVLRDLEGDLDEVLAGDAETAAAEGFPDIASWFRSVRAQRVDHAGRVLGAQGDGGAA
jgi:rubrerythrin